MLFCTAVFCVQLLNLLPIDQWFALYPIGPSFYPWQLFTYAFLHGGFLHLFFNMFALWSFGSEMERLWGPRRYIEFLTVCVLTAGIAQEAIAYATGSPYATIGASGGIFGLLLAFGMLFPDRMIMMMIPPIPMKAKYYVAIFGAIELFFGVYGGGGGIAHFAHLGGMLGGYLMIRYWRGKPPFGGRGPRRMH